MYLPAGSTTLWRGPVIGCLPLPDLLWQPKHKSRYDDWGKTLQNHIHWGFLEHWFGISTVSQLPGWWCWLKRCGGVRPPLGGPSYHTWTCDCKSKWCVSVIRLHNMPPSLHLVTSDSVRILSRKWLSGPSFQSPVNTPASEMCLLQGSFISV